MNKILAAAALAACCFLGACQSNPEATNNGAAVNCCKDGKPGCEAGCASENKKSSCSEGKSCSAGEAKACSMGEAKSDAKSGCCGGNAEAKAAKEAAGGKCCGSDACKK
jgi:hypothetical protein